MTIKIVQHVICLKIYHKWLGWPGLAANGCQNWSAHIHNENYHKWLEWLDLAANDLADDLQYSARITMKNYHKRLGCLGLVFTMKNYHKWLGQLVSTLNAF